MFRTEVVEEIKTHVLCAVTYETVKKYRESWRGCR
jgi:hypothetical protein